VIQTRLPQPSAHEIATGKSDAQARLRFIRRWEVEIVGVADIHGIDRWMPASLHRRSCQLDPFKGHFVPQMTWVALEAFKLLLRPNNHVIGDAQSRQLAPYLGDGALPLREWGITVY
jgi:hypothetical protein